MTTTIVRNSIVGDDWIRQMQQLVPPQKVYKKDAQGQMVWTGDILSGPVRLSWVNLFKAKKGMESDPNSAEKFSVVLLFPPPLPGQDVNMQMALFYEEYYRICAEKFANHWNGQQYVGLHSPFHDQGEKFKYDGYTAGCISLGVSSQFKPPVVKPIPGDPNNFNPVLTEAEAHPGVWAIVAMNAYGYGMNAKGPNKKGPGFGIQSVIIIGDDTNIGGGKQADPQQAFGAIAGNLPAPIVRPNFGALPGGSPIPQTGAAPMAPPPPVFNGIPQQQPGTPTTITTTYRPVPPPMSAPDDDDMSWNR